MPTPGPTALVSRFSCSLRPPSPHRTTNVCFCLFPRPDPKVLSTKRSHNGVGFGTGNRPDLLVQSTADVGPGEYSVPGATGELQARSAYGRPPALSKGAYPASRGDSQDLLFPAVECSRSQRKYGLIALHGFNVVDSSPVCQSLSFVFSFRDFGG